MVSSHFLTFLCFRLIIVFSFSVFSEPGSGFVKILYFYPLVLCANSSSEQHGKKKLAIEKPFLAHTYSSGLVKWTFTASQLRAAHRIALRCITTFATVSIPFLKQLCLWAILSWAKFIQVHVWICKRKFCYYENSYSTARLTKNHFPIWQFEKMRLFDFFPLWSPHLRCKSSSVLILLCSGHVSLLPFAALASIFQAAIRKTLTIQNRKKSFQLNAEIGCNIAILSAPATAHQNSQKMGVFSAVGNRQGYQWCIVWVSVLLSCFFPVRRRTFFTIVVRFLLFFLVVGPLCASTSTHSSFFLVPFHFRFCTSFRLKSEFIDFRMFALVFCLAW